MRKLKLKDELRLYKELKKRRDQEIVRLEKAYLQKAKELISEILDELSELEHEEPPQKVDPTLLKIGLRERDSYVSSLRRLLGNVSSMEDLGRYLREVSKLHVGHGRYLLVLFEKRVYSINSLLKELGELYSRYKLEKQGVLKSVPDLRIEELVEEAEKTTEQIDELSRKLESLREELKRLEREGITVQSGLERDEKEAKLRELETKLRTLEVEVSSKVSKLKKPLKKSRLPEAKAFVEDSGEALKNPEDFLSLLEKVKGKLDKRQLAAAKWLEENLLKKADEISKLRLEIDSLMEEIREEETSRANLSREIEKLRDEISSLESHIQKLQKHLKNVQSEMEKELQILRDISENASERQS